MKLHAPAAVIVSLLLIALIAGCTQQQNQPDNDDTAQPPRDVMKGVSLSPKSFQGSDFTDFFVKASEAGSIVTWAGDWNELANTQSGGPVVVTSLAAQYEYEPVIQAQFFTQSSGQLLRLLGAATREAYVNDAAAFAQRYKPPYMGFGIEVNVLYEKSPADFDVFVSLFSDVTDAVKAASPETKVFTVFQLEKMKGLNGGLFGGTNDPANAQWSLISRFPKADLIAFTTYPGLIYKDPSEIPADYYGELSSKTGKPIAFTEIGWHAAASPRGWESSGDEQREFVETFFQRIDTLNPQFVIWSFVYDQDTIEPFDSMGLLARDGTVRPSWDAWVSA